jgi:hypothetical protein
MPNYGDYNSTPVLYLLSNLGSNFYVRTHVDNEDSQDNSVMNNQSIFIRITNAFLPNLPNSYASDDYKNDCFVHHLTSRGYIQLVDANLVPVDLLYLMKISLFVEFY